MTITLADLNAMKQSQLMEIVMQGNPLPLEQIANHSYTGVDLSMPALFHKLAWKTFRKTFYRDPMTGVIRGWNVKVEQTGWDTPPEPKRDKEGRPISFGHYEVREAAGLKFPRGWQGGHYLDYRDAGNRFFDVPARMGYCPLVAVNEGSGELLLGWEIFNVAGLQVPLRDFWALKREGPLRDEDIVARPVDQKRLAAG